MTNQPDRISNRYQDPIGALVASNPLIAAVIGLPSLTVLVFLRGWLGYRFARPLTIGLVAVPLAVLSYFTHDRKLLVFTAVVAVLSFLHRRKGWRLVFSDGWHTMSRGVSYLSHVLPFLSENTIQRRIEPLICYGAGLLLLIISKPLGLWVMFAGAMLAVSEALVYERAINEMLDRHDARAEAKGAKEVDAIVKNGGRAKDVSLGNTGGVIVPVTIAPELQALMDAEGDRPEDRPLAA